jgi:hypothetical protein
MGIDFFITEYIKIFPQWAGFVLFVAAVIYIVWKASEFYFKTKSTNQQIIEINSTLSRMEGALAILNSVLLEKNIISKSCFSQENSPRVLNELGKKLLEESGAERVFEEMKEELLSALETESPESLLEIERKALEVMLANMSNPHLREVQNFAFEHPSFGGSPLTYSDILFTVALQLRDEYRSRHPEKIST